MMTRMKPLYPGFALYIWWRKRRAEAVARRKSRDAAAAKGCPVLVHLYGSTSPEAAIQRVARAGRYDLVVVGTSLREGATKSLGPRSSALLRNLNSPTLLVTQ